MNSLTRLVTSKFKRSRGFTLLETLTVIGILAVTATFGNLVLARHNDRLILEESMRLVATEHLHAATLAISGYRDQPSGIRIFPNQLVRFVGASYAARDTTEDVVVDFPQTFTITGTTEWVIALRTGRSTPSAPSLTLNNGKETIQWTGGAYGTSTFGTITP